MDPLLIPICALAIPIVAIPVSLTHKYFQRARELEHVERMHALQSGTVLAKDESWWSPPRISVAIGGAVPLGAMLAGLTATESSGFHEGIWIACAMVGVAGVICGTCLASQHLASRSKAVASSPKPEFDPEHFDVVGRRG